MPWQPGGTRPTAPNVVDILGRLSTRDHTILTLLQEHQVLTTEHLAALAPFPSHDRAQQRLRTLFQLHLLDRFRHRGLDGINTPWRYLLGAAGAELLAAAQGTEPPKKATLRRRQLRIAAHPALNHLLGVNGFFADLARHQPVVWLSERSATAACDALARPDALGMVGGLVFCLEYDTGTESLTTLVNKLDGYRELSASGGPEIPGHTAVDAQVLFLLPNTQRERNLRNRLTTPGCQVATTHSDLVQRHSPAGPIWLPASSTTRHDITQLD
ncbi:hypothetical protein D5S17_14590 [Pseudonocardiaceae bacterium YIM PH 21723]|nr:hypothetical protein D5S17_14590 [Pseudonocardiaceae bacterium YIM PH 21723]